MSRDISVEDRGYGETWESCQRECAHVDICLCGLVDLWAGPQPDMFLMDGDECPRLVALAQLHRFLALMVHGKSWISTFLVGQVRMPF